MCQAPYAVMRLGPEKHTCLLANQKEQSDLRRLDLLMDYIRAWREKLRTPQPDFWRRKRSSHQYQRDVQLAL